MNSHEHPTEGIAAAAFEVAAATASLVSNLLTHVEHLVGDVVADASDVVRNGSDLWDVAAERAEDIGRVVTATPRFARIAGELLRIIAAYRLHFAVTAPRAELRGAAAEARNARSVARLERRTPLRAVRRAARRRAQARAVRLDARRPAARRVRQRALTIAGSRAAGADRRHRRADRATSSARRRTHASSSSTANRSPPHRSRRCTARNCADGTSVAVKVQVPGIEAIVNTDLMALRVVVPALGDLVPFLDLETISAELARALRAELDYRDEAGHAAAFADRFAGDAEVVVPRVHSELSTQRVLVLERLHGERLTDYLDACEQRGERGARGPRSPVRDPHPQLLRTGARARSAARRPAPGQLPRLAGSRRTAPGAARFRLRAGVSAGAPARLCGARPCRLGERCAAHGGGLRRDGISRPRRQDRSAAGVRRGAARWVSRRCVVRQPRDRCARSLRTAHSLDARQPDRRDSAATSCCSAASSPRSVGC